MTNGTTRGGASGRGARARDGGPGYGNGPGAGNGHENALERFARNMAVATGRPWAFLLAVGLVVGWALSGPLFGFSNTWQLVINTTTTIVTFLMVFLIQRAQNRDTMALQAKLAELVIHVRGAKNEVAVAEDLSEQELQALHDLHSAEAQERMDRLEDAAAAVGAGKRRPPAAAK
jgi:low affinity Fe/Cu permease